MRSLPLLAAAIALGLLCAERAIGQQPLGAPTALEQQLAREDPAALAKAARREGDAVRGAILFHQPRLTCVQCHTTGEQTARLGPDLSKPEPNAGDAHVVQSLLEPSKTIRKGYETVTVMTEAGQVISGILVEDRADRLVLREGGQDGRTRTLAKREIAERKTGGTSLMPTGLINQLSSRQQFLDLLRYLLEIAAGGPRRAAELRPNAGLLAAPPLPAYESDVDHAGMIAALDRRSFERGRAIYENLCVNCHGTKDRPGSLPTSLRFASGQFKSGSDPYSMYRTLTHGFGMMTPQSWMVPEQKYDVIHFIREAYLRDSNRSQFFRVTPEYLATLPKGTSRGPKPTNVEPWAKMDYGPSLLATFEIGERETNFAYKGIAVRLDAGPGGVARGGHWIVYDHDTLRAAAGWSGSGFIDWNGINFNGRHEVHPRVVGQVQVANPTGPGWADPETGRFDDTRFRGRDGRPYGPLPRAWARYLGLYHFDDRAILSYSVGKAKILEMPGLESDPSRKDATVFTRTLQIERSPRDLVARVAPAGAGVALVGGNGARLVESDGYLVLQIPRDATPTSLKLLVSRADAAALRAYASSAPPPLPLAPLTVGGPRRWPEVLKTTGTIGDDAGPFAVDVLAPPVQNPWFCQIRPTGFDFMPDGRRIALCTWDGDVWLVDGIDKPETGLAWQRIASGLFQPLGLKVVEGRIYVSCRDQIVILRDLNGDGETDFYECFNSDHQVTEHFHEFAMGLQTDDAGNFYYAKSAQHAKTALVPHHGTLLRVSTDGSRTDILATGFRAANGVCVNGDGTFFVTDQEGHWNPKNRINWVTPGGFYGNMWGYHDVSDASDSAMQPPLCWITNSFDRSPSELVWVPRGAWGPLAGSLLNFSYGYGKVYVVPHERLGNLMQGGMCELPIPQFPTGVMRGRFHPKTGQLYCCGMFSWAGNQTQTGGFYRVRYTGKPLYVPVGLTARRQGMAISLSGILERTAAEDAGRYAVKTWTIKRTANYGSEHYDEKPLRVASAELSVDGKTVSLELPELKATWCMEIRYQLRAVDGSPVQGVIHNTVHELGTQ